MERLLRGIRVLDLTNVLAGPFGAYQLALLGADVIKVEAPGLGDLARQFGADTQLDRDLMGASFLAQNAGKRSVTVNLKSDAGKDVFGRLVRSADVVIENFRPGVMARLGSGYFATGDGPLDIAANRQQQFETLVRLIGRPELATDPRFAEREARRRNRFVLKAEIETALAKKSASAWSALLNVQGVPAGEVLDIPAVLAHPQFASRDLVKTFDAGDGAAKPVAVVRSGFRLKSGDPAPAMPPPRLGADTQDMLASLGYGVEEIAALRRAKAI